jgi:hypothetical protein
MDTTLIGIDCATQEEKVGIAVGRFNGPESQIDHVILCGKASPLERTLLSWIPKSGRLLFALDAPLGWPQPMGHALSQHVAGGHIVVSGNALFRRDTDRFIKRHTGQQPLDVGADRIARTALSALDLLARLGETIGETIHLAWSAQFPHRIAAIEVYPAATLRARGLSSKGYKKPEQVEARRVIIAAIPELAAASNALSMEAHADALDAALCLSAAADFLTGQVFLPENQALAEKEGWIWVRRPAD